MNSRLLEGLKAWRNSRRAGANIREYVSSGRRPWSPGYADYREKFLRETLQERTLRDIFLRNKPLPAGYGLRLDERVIEYPWIISRLGAGERRLLDAGSTLNFPYLLDLPELQSRSVVIYTLAPERELKRDNVSYLYGDLRQTEFADESFDEVVCISTLEHVGMDNTFLYSPDERHKESHTDDYPQVVREFRRLLRPGGRLFLTVPCGRYENLGWLQQFDQSRIEKIIRTFGGSAIEHAYYKYSAEGWQASSADACADCSYFDVHHRREFEPDYVAAARCVACLMMVK